MQISELSKKAAEIRAVLFEMVCAGGGGHIPSALSIVELLVVMYYRILNVDASNPKKADRDRFILSKGHACTALYPILADKGFIGPDKLRQFGKKGTCLGGHPDMHLVAGVEASTGALGHGFPFGLGIALAGKFDKAPYRVYVVLGDGECQEGTIWEAALFAAQHKLDNLVAIIDHNKLQAMAPLGEIVSLDSLAEKWRAFGWAVKEIDGHNIKEIAETLEATPFESGRPNLIIAHTVKGKGISYMENVPIWHFRLPNSEEMAIAKRELQKGEDA